MIGYARAGYLHLFPALFQEVIIPQAVRDELLRGGNRPGAHEARENPPWLRTAVAPTNQTLANCLSRSLGQGESEAIALAELLGLPLILEDGDARKMARNYVATIVGSGTIVRSAVQEGLVTDGKTILASLQCVGYRLGPQVIAAILASL
jgi:predicted nucleic acid-binding protein